MPSYGTSAWYHPQRSVRSICIMLNGCLANLCSLSCMHATETWYHYLVQCLVSCPVICSWHKALFIALARRCGYGSVRYASSLLHPDPLSYAAVEPAPHLSVCTPHLWVGRSAPRVWTSPLHRDKLQQSTMLQRVQLCNMLRCSQWSFLCLHHYANSHRCQHYSVSFMPLSRGASGV